MTVNNNEKLGTLRFWADQTGLSYDFLRRACLDGKLKHIRCGVKYMVRSDWFNDFLEDESQGGEVGTIGGIRG